MDSRWQERTFPIHVENERRAGRQNTDGLQSQARARSSGLEVARQCGSAPWLFRMGIGVAHQPSASRDFDDAFFPYRRPGAASRRRIAAVAG